MANSFDDFIDMCASTVTHTTIASRDAYGKETTGTSTAMRARVSYDQSRTVSPTAEDIPVHVRLWCPPPGYVPAGGVATPICVVNDRITLPADPHTYSIVSIDVPLDEDGNAHHQSIGLAQT